MNLSRTLGILAAIVLAVSFSTLAFNSMKAQESLGTVEITGEEFTWEELEEEYGLRTIGEHKGLPLSDIVNDTGLEDPDKHQYRITGVDGYQKTVKWKDMLNCVIDMGEKRTVFPHLPKAMYVRDVVEIEAV